MRSILLRSLIGASLLLGGLSAGMAQDRDRDRDRDDSYYQRRDAFFHEEHWRARLFEHVRDDLNQIQSTTFPASRDELRIVRTKEELGTLQENMASHRYDERALDDVISGVQRVIDSNKLSGRDRDMLGDDLARLRDYRENHEHWER
jgi:hypothetical protein